jgi:hypothetical protein
MKTSHLAGTLALAAIVAALPAAATTRYHLVDLGPASGSTDINGRSEVSGGVGKSAALFRRGTWYEKNDSHDSVALGLDERGNMVGVEQDRQGVYTPMYYPRGAKDFAIPLPEGADQADMLSFVPVGISLNGHQVAGSYMTLASVYAHCFLWSPGDATSTDIGLPAGYHTCEAWGVNDHGEIVGHAWSDTSSASFVYQDGVFTLVGKPDVDHLERINTKGRAVGGRGNRAGGVAIWWNGLRMQRVPAMGGLKMQEAMAINDEGVIVGSGVDGARGTILRYADGVLDDVVPMIENPEGWDFTGRLALPTGINVQGEITGNAMFDDGSGKKHARAYILVPQD